jgi:hypothetical protein
VLIVVPSVTQTLILINLFVKKYPLDITWLSIPYYSLVHLNIVYSIKSIFLWSKITNGDMISTETLNLSF